MPYWRGAEVLTYSVLIYTHFNYFQLVKQAILPRVHGLALKTTVAAVCMFLCLQVNSY
jgi:hypothetical protein